MQKQEDKLTIKSSLNEQKYFFITFNMKKMTPVFHSNYFFSFQNQFSLYLHHKAQNVHRKMQNEF